MTNKSSISVNFSSSVKTVIALELSSLLTSFSFPDTDIVCQDGSISINRIFIFFLFPHLADTLPFTTQGNPVVFLPDRNIKDVWGQCLLLADDLKHLYGTPIKTFDRCKENINLEEELDYTIHLKDDSVDILTEPGELDFKIDENTRFVF